MPCPRTSHTRIKQSFINARPRIRSRTDVSSIKPTLQPHALQHTTLRLCIKRPNVLLARNYCCSVVVTKRHRTASFRDRQERSASTATATTDPCLSSFQHMVKEDCDRQRAAFAGRHYHGARPTGGIKIRNYACDQGGGLMVPIHAMRETEQKSVWESC